ncbi:UDP-2,3-diacylglucosamine diphosphatase [Campylobacter sp.]|uniref:UDP-2,3-diacylglucosamine diphosphatase n=1 Tax=Campylobacter sp. TaxID=205 RepID=UPI002707D38D|nr:UDP-2,3-diacylglucosamine diphosphatase [Campylobacter sp.]
MIKNGAIFIADSHANENRPEFLKFLRELKEGRISAPQLFLMGDMFDFLSDFCDYTLKFASEHLELINELSHRMEIYYFEGNHDFNLSKILKNAEVFPIAAQPVKFKTECGQNAAIAHGDIFLPFVSKYALRFLRLKPFLKCMNFIDNLLNFKISKAIFEKLRHKNLTYKILNFKNLAAKRIQNYTDEIVIEGHFHQGDIFEFQNQQYINVPSFACERSYFVVEYDPKIKFALKSARGQDV